MKKIFRASQKKDVLGRQVSGRKMHIYGLPYNGASGTFFPKQDRDAIDLMLAAADHYFPEIHVTSTLQNGHMLNLYVENAELYHLYTGNTDPEIEFNTENLKSDYTEEEEEHGRRMKEQYLNEPLDAADIAAVNWLFRKFAK